MSGSSERVSSENAPLMGHPDSESSTIDYERHPATHNFEKSRQLGTSPALSIFIFTALAISILSFFLNAVQFVVRPPYEPGVLDVRSLRRPSLYLGLERVPEIQAVTEAVKAAQAAVGQQSGSGAAHDGHGDEGVGALVDELLHASRIIRINADFPRGYFPSDPWVLLTPKDVVYMEFTPPPLVSSCVPKLFLPKRADLQNKMLTIEGASPFLGLRVMPPSFQIDRATWANRPLPNEGRRLSNVFARFGFNNSLPSIPCVSGERFVLELSCFHIGCRIEFEDSVGSPRLGLQMDTKLEQLTP
ncbi:hypothetical protein HGRIS_012129 [Hohenbuehelia grisea]|uniref:Transmembrane protein n=1 Tax=Hohenbuehelia grisea TaxID=104357 RepID=A0ABR3IRB3_9AGAR